MEAFKKIQLSFKCPKALDELQPCDGNWYCDECKKMVHDFRGMTEQQVLDIFVQNGKKLCGIYEADRIKVLPQKTQWYKWAAVMALGIAILNGCGWGQRNNTEVLGEKRIKQPGETHFMGEPAPPADSLTQDTLKNNPGRYKHGKITKVKFPLSNLVGDVEIAEDITVAAIVGTKPQFPGGNDAFASYIAQKLKYSGNRTGRAFAQFVVEKDGSLTDIKIVRSVGEDIDRQIIAALAESKNWQPATINNHPERVRLIMPVSVTCRD